MLVLFLLLVSISIWFIAPWGQFPLNDDWVYTQNVLSSILAGRIEIKYGQYAYALPQMLTAGFLLDRAEEPFLKLRWIGIMSGLLSVLILCKLCERVIKQKSSILFFLGSVSVFFFLPFFQPALSFMTDAPAFLLWVLSLWTLFLFLEKGGAFSWLLAIIVNAIAVSERQLAIFIPFSVFVAQSTWFRFRMGWEGISRVFRKSYPIMLFAVPLVLIQWWWSFKSPVKVPETSFSPNPGVLIRFSRHLICLGWIAIPFAAVPLQKALDDASKKIFKRLLFIFVLGFLLHVANWIFFSSHLFPPFFDNILSRQGILTLVISGTPEIIFPFWFEFILFLLGFLGVLRILWGGALLWGELPKNKGIEVIGWSSLTYLVFICFRAAQFDRYIIPVLPLSLLCLLRSCSRDRLTPPQILASGVVCLLYFAFSVTLVSDYFRWNEARRQAIDFAVSTGTRPNEVCAGYEYDTWKQADPKTCKYAVGFSELPEFKTEQRFPYSSIWGSPTRNMYLLKKWRRERDSNSR